FLSVWHLVLGIVVAGHTSLGIVRPHVGECAEVEDDPEDLDRFGCGWLRGCPGRGDDVRGFDPGDRGDLVAAGGAVLQQSDR
ncbi:hypothetical protein ACFVJS_11535, partial [Nocardioides sp. NPDC057772]|uniref:hypothetical protein n=1 Tax=Nocardioides sp. NPDC057772 TaxID=3346245 RepID=UPI00366F6B20